MGTTNSTPAHGVSSDTVLKTCSLPPAPLELPCSASSNTITRSFAQSLKFSFCLPLRSLREQPFLGAGCRKAHFHLGARGEGPRSAGDFSHGSDYSPESGARRVGQTPKLWQEMCPSLQVWAPSSQLAVLSRPLSLHLGLKSLRAFQQHTPGSVLALTAVRAPVLSFLPFKKHYLLKK